MGSTVVTKWRLSSGLMTALLLLLVSGACSNQEPQPSGPDRHALGAADAAVTLVAFDDYQ